MTLKLSKYEVTLIDQLTWGQREKIRASILSGMKLTPGRDVDMTADALVTAKYTAIEIAVTKITDADGKEITFTRSWLDNLSVEDGDTLFEAVDAITNPEKKV